ncbi:MAG: serine/threonine-protein kinase, partial [Thermoanaerobaculia bacterium]|nr:serine/threonine-protein kinase [Thermoanaerobaculia bacterium]
MSPVTTEVRETYEVLAKLAEGGMGTIYQVRHRHLDQLRVIKVMRPQLGDHDEFEARFLREARMEAQLQHPNIAQLHEFEVTSSGAAYMVMEYIDGVSLKDALAATGPLSVPLGLEVGRQSLEALAYLHESGVVHRDISPDNLMFSRDPAGRPLVKLIDLGIAKRAQEGEEHRITVTGAFLGKVHYASPEQFRGADIDRRTDVYSFGIALYELLTGVFPIPGSDTNSLIAGHLVQPPKSFEESDPEGRIPESLRRIILQALAKDREERPATRDFAERLDTLQGEGTWDREEVDRILEAGAREPEPVSDTEIPSLLGTAPTLPVTADPETAPTRSLGRTETAGGSLPGQQTWSTRVLGRPGRRWIRVLGVALALTTAAIAGVLLA